MKNLQTILQEIENEIFVLRCPSCKSKRHIVSDVVDRFCSSCGYRGWDEFEPDSPENN